MRMTYFDRAIYTDYLFHDDLESLPGNNFIELGEVNNFFKGKDFSYIGNEGETVKVKVSPEIFMAFDYYYNVWDDFNELGVLPHGSGTLKEFPWVPDIIKFFNRVKRVIDLHKK